MSTTYVDQVQEPLPNTNTTVYTATGSGLTSAHIIYATAHNYSSSSANIIVNIVQSGGTAASTNRYINRNIAPGDTVDLTEIVGAVLLSGDFVSAIAGASSAINLKIGVQELTT